MKAERNDPLVNVQARGAAVAGQVDHQRLAEAIVAGVAAGAPAGQHSVAAELWKDPPLNGIRHHHEQMTSRVIGGYYNHGDRVRTPTPSDDEMAMPGGGHRPPSSWTF